MAGDADQDGLGEVDLRATQPGPTSGHPGVREGVVADLVTVANSLAHEAGVAGGLAADYEESAGDVLAPQNGHDLGCPLRVRAVVKGQRDPLTRIGLR